MCKCNSKKAVSLPATNPTIQRIIADPWTDMVLNDPSVTEATKIFSGVNNEGGAYLGMRKHGDQFKGPASSLAQARFVTPIEWASMSVTTSSRKAKATVVEVSE